MLSWSLTGDRVAAWKRRRSGLLLRRSFLFCHLLVFVFFHTCHSPFAKVMKVDSSSRVETWGTKSDCIDEVFYHRSNTQKRGQDSHLGGSKTSTSDLLLIVCLLGFRAGLLADPALYLRQHFLVSAWLGRQNQTQSTISAKSFRDVASTCTLVEP